MREPPEAADLDRFGERDVAELMERVQQLIEPKLKRPQDLPEVMRELRMEVTMSGPIPSPGALQAYGKVDEDLPARIVVMAEKEQGFRHEMGRREMAIAESVTETDGKALLRGQAAGIAVVVGLLAGGIAALWEGRLEAGYTAFASAILAYVASWVTGKRPSSQQVEPKKDQMQERAKK